MSIWSSAAHRASQPLLCMVKWERYPVDQVLAGIRTYLEKDCAGQGKGEAYLYGIIKKNNSAPVSKESSTPVTPVWL